MSQDKGSSRRKRMTVGMPVLGLVSLLALVISPVLAQGGPIVLDGVGDDWDPAWQVATDGLDVFLTDTGQHPHQPPEYARSGYDAIGLWARFQITDLRWYFRIDVDGRAGDADSAVGSPGNLGVATHGFDEGPLVAPPFEDRDGLGNSEAYRLGFQCSQGATGQTSEISNSETILPGVVSPTTAGLTGQGVYSTTVPGVVEFVFDRDTLFPAGSNCSEFWLSAQVGDNNDRVSDDQVAATLVVALDLAPNCPQAPSVVGSLATFPVNYQIPAAAAQGASDVILMVAVPAGTTFVGASNGGSESNGVITWQLGDLAPGEAGQVTFTLRLDQPGAVLVIDSQMTCAEGLVTRASNECPTQQVPPESPPAVPEPATITLMLTGMGGLAGYAALQWRARRRQ